MKKKTTKKKIDWKDNLYDVDLGLFVDQSLDHSFHKHNQSIWWNVVFLIIDLYSCFRLPILPLKANVVVVVRFVSIVHVLFGMVDHRIQLLAVDPSLVPLLSVDQEVVVVVYVYFY